MGALLGEPGGGDPLMEDLKVMKGRLEGWAYFLMGAQLGNLVCAPLPEMWLRGALSVECLSLWELCEGNLEGGVPCWGP
jgi:hypothetical protein